MLAPKASMEINSVADVIELRVANGSVTLQALSTSSDDRTAVAIVPGLAETAADWRELIELLAPIPAAAVTLRGRGSSSCPPSGYSLADHASDIDAFVRYLPARSVVLVAFSRSVAYALEYATARPSKLAGLVLLDYPTTPQCTAR
jgi:pimeloyl-ACP methyl ester carboxylesterase